MQIRFILGVGSFFKCFLIWAKRSITVFLPYSSVHFNYLKIRGILLGSAISGSALKLWSSTVTSVRSLQNRSVSFPKPIPHVFTMIFSQISRVFDFFPFKFVRFDGRTSRSAIFGVFSSKKCCFEGIFFSNS